MPDASDGAQEYEFYEPQYFVHSKTYRAWVKLFIKDCYALRVLEGFESTRARFWKNHPIRWIQLVGIVTGINIKAAHAEIEIDDGSGRCMDLYLKGDVTDSIKINFEENTSLVDVGDLVKVKGSLANDFKSDLQVLVDRIEMLKDPLQELTAWQERLSYRTDVLDKPWRCEAAYMRDQPSTVKVTASGEHKPAKRTNEQFLRKEKKKQHAQIDLPALDPQQHTQRNLKTVFLQYFQKNKTHEFSVRQLRASPDLELAVLCVAQRSLQSLQLIAGLKREEDTQLTITSTQKYRTINACLAELVRDGSIISTDTEKGLYAVVGRWNLGQMMQDIMQELFAKDVHRVEVTVREMWQAVRQSGRGFDSISKQMVQRMLGEMQAEVAQTLEQ